MGPKKNKAWVEHKNFFSVSWAGGWNESVLKMMAQFMPLGSDMVDMNSPGRQIITNQATLEHRPLGGSADSWKSSQTTRVNSVDRGAHFRIEGWDASRDWEYRILLRGWE